MILNTVLVEILASIAKIVEMFNFLHVLDVVETILLQYELQFKRWIQMMVRVVDCIEILIGFFVSPTVLIIIINCC